MSAGDFSEVLLSRSGVSLLPRSPSGPPPHPSRLRPWLLLKSPLGPQMCWPCLRRHVWLHKPLGIGRWNRSSRWDYLGSNLLPDAETKLSTLGQWVEISVLLSGRSSLA